VTTEAFVERQAERLDALCRALDADEWDAAVVLSREIDAAVADAPMEPLSQPQLEALGSRHAAYLRSLVAARQRLALVSERMTGVQRAMRAYAHLNDQD